MSKRYICDWCKKPSTSEEWCKATINNGKNCPTDDQYPDDWNMENADGGDTVCCPICGTEDERSEVEEVTSPCKYVNVDAMDNNGSGYRFSVQTAEDNALAVVKTIVNKTCLVVATWGYGEYSAIYDDKMSTIEKGMESDSSACVRFAGVFGFLDISITDEPTWDEYSVEDGLREWDNVLLEGYEYDPDTDSYDLHDIIPELGVEEYEYA